MRRAEGLWALVVRLGIVLAAIVGFFVPFFVTLILVVRQSQAGECDGICTDTFPLIGLVLAAGTVGAVLGALAAYVLIERGRHTARRKVN